MIKAEGHGAKLQSSRMTVLRGPLLWFALWAVGLVGCTQEMAEQPRYDPLDPSAFFADGRSARRLVEGTVARGYAQLDEHQYAGTVAGLPAATLPVPLTQQLLTRGQQRYDIYCSPCHDRVGNGQGMIVRRGLGPPPSLHIERLRQAPIGHFFLVMTNGFGTMPSYATQVPAHDRWAIAAYVRALQLSQYATLADLSEQERRQFEDVR
jgi:mono/diheme cytochrome c family protein